MSTPTVSTAFDPSPLTHALREQGYAITIFNPGELREVEARRVEDRLAELGNEAIEDLRGPKGSTSAPAMDAFDPSPMTRSLREHGYAVTVFSPSELQGVDPDELEDRLAELGNEVIDDLVALRKATTPSRPARPGR